MNPKTVVYFKKEGRAWKIRRGKNSYIRYEGISRLLRTISTLILDKDLIISGHIEVLRKKK